MFWELTWAPDSRATFHFGNQVREGEPPGNRAIRIRLVS